MGGIVRRRSARIKSSPTLTPTLTPTIRIRIRIQIPEEAVGVSDSVGVSERRGAAQGAASSANI